MKIRKWMVLAVSIFGLGGLFMYVGYTKHDWYVVCMDVGWILGTMYGFMVGVS